jgi:outer membrane protein assembly factor BamB
VTRRRIVLAGALLLTLLAFDGVIVIGALGRWLVGAAVPAHSLSVAGTDAVVVTDQRTQRVFVLSPARPRTPAQVTVLDAHTGAVLHHVAIGSHAGSPDGSLALVPDTRTGTMFAAVDGYDATGPTVSLLDGGTGAVRTTTAVSQANNTLALDERTQRLFVASTAYDPSTAGAHPRSAVSMLDARTGATLHRLTLPGFATAVSVDQQRDHALVLIQNSMGGVPGRRGGQLYVLDGRTGQVVRHQALPLPVDPVYPGLTVAATTGRVLLNGAAVFLLTTLRGTAPLQSLPVQGYPVAAVVVDHGSHLVAATQGGGVAPLGHILLLDATSGRVLRTTAVPGDPMALTSDERRGEVLVAKAQGYDDRGQTVRRMSGRWAGAGVLVVDAHTGVIRRLVPVAGVPRQVAVDEPSGHAFVVASASCGLSPVRRWLPFVRIGPALGAVQCVSMLDVPQ